MTAQAFDFHQHLWPEPLQAELSRRRTAPRLRGSVLELPREGSFDVDLAGHDVDRRIQDLDRDEIDVGIVSLAPTLDFELLPQGERDRLVDAYHEGMREVVRRSSGRLLALAAGAPVDGFAGVSLAGRELAELDRSAPLLDELERRGEVVFVHPGPSSPPGDAPAWWSAVVDYTVEMQVAYASWLARGAARWPALRVVFAILAGGAPFQRERLGSRGVRSAAPPANVSFETASYGTHALELSLATCGVDHLLYGSDAPVIDPRPTLEAVRGLGEDVTDALLRRNAARLFGPVRAGVGERD